jgi:N-acetylmuramoyl-L-alanine amidase
MNGFHPDSPLVTKAHPSPNHGERRMAPNSIILHYTGMASAELALARLCDPAAEVSCHYLVDEDGRILQLVAEDRRAWHAGKSCWAGERDMNSASIGIELANGGHDFGSPPFAAAQIEAAIALCRDIMNRRKIVAWRVLGHSDIAPSRKADPGEKFPWEQFARFGIGCYVAPHPIGHDVPLARGSLGADVAALQSMLADFGYDIDVTGHYDAATETVVAAFQRHYRPLRVDGKADHSTRATLEALLAACSKQIIA